MSWLTLTISFVGFADWQFQKRLVQRWIRTRYLLTKRGKGSNANNIKLRNRNCTKKLLVSNISQCNEVCIVKLQADTYGQLCKTDFWLKSGIYSFFLVFNLRFLHLQWNLLKCKDNSPFYVVPEVGCMHFNLKHLKYTSNDMLYK